MCPRKSTAKLVDVLGYTLPKLHEGKKWYVDFYAPDPETKEVRRKKYYVDGVKGKRARRAAADSIIAKLTTKLRSGWNPWAETKCASGTKLFNEVLDSYLNNLGKSHRKSSVYNYTSRAKVLREYIATLKTPPLYAYQFDRTFCMGFLDWILSEHDASARTRNNYRGWLSALGEFMVDRGHLDDNPVSRIKKMQEPRKRRQPMSSEMLHTLFRHRKETDKRFLLACLMEYYTFIRPNELRHVRLRDISIKDQTVFIPCDVSKNKKDGKVSLNEEIIRLMVELKVFDNPADYYLFGKGFTPSVKMCKADMFNRRWADLRKELKFDNDIKFYSLKDSGIRDLSNSAGVVTARDQARHQDVATTNKYLGGRDLSAPEAAKHFKGELS